MDMHLAVTPNSSDLLLWGGVCLIVSSLLYLKLFSVLEKTRRAFRALQPELSISRSATVYSHGEDTLTIYLRNDGRSKATDIRVTVHGGEGIAPLPVIPVMVPGDSEQEIWVKAKACSPLFQEKRDRIRLHIRYRDQWGYAYSLSHPVVQRESIHGWVALQLVERAKSRTVKPNVSFWRMRMALILSSSEITGKDGDESKRYRIDHSTDSRQSHFNGYLARVWLSQNKDGRQEDTRRFIPHTTRVSSN